MFPVCGECIGLIRTMTILTYRFSDRREKGRLAFCLQKNHQYNQERNISCICNKAFVRLWIYREHSAMKA